MLEAFDVFNSLSSTTAFSKFVLPEKRCSLGTEHINDLLNAMQDEKIVEFMHLKYHETIPTHRQVEPYALKEFKGRWYLLCKDLKDEEIKTFGLDRISDLNVKNRNFIYPKEFDAKALFKNSYGVINQQEGKPEEIILSIEPFQGKYLKSYPLHESQQILIDNKEEFRISLNLFITHDFIMELLSLGKSLKVVQPQRLINELSTIISEMNSNLNKQ
jgi:predicted DNA-binding transcriptional regulator YafY